MDIRFSALLVDDEMELVAALAERLAYRGVRADVATSGSEALEKMEQAAYDVVLLDLKLPGMSGVEVLRKIRQAYPQVPVILITGHGAPIDVPDLDTGEAFDYLPKPVDLEILVATMQKAVDRT